VEHDNEAVEHDNGAVEYDNEVVGKDIVFSQRSLIKSYFQKMHCYCDE